MLDESKLLSKHAITSDLKSTITIVDKVQNRTIVKSLDIMGRELLSRCDIKNKKLVEAKKYDGKLLKHDVSFDLNKQLAEISTDADKFSELSKIFEIKDEQATSNKHILRKSLPVSNMIVVNTSVNNINLDSIENVVFTLKAKITNSDGTIRKFEERYTKINSRLIELPIIINRDMVSTIQVQFICSKTILRGIISDITLVNADGVCYSYDKDKNLIFQETGTLLTEYSNYVDGIPTIITSKDTYGKTTRKVSIYNASKQLKYCEDERGNCVEISYDDKGQLVEKVEYNKEDPTNATITKNQYDENGNITYENGIMRDGNGDMPGTKFEHNSITGMLQKTISPSGSVTTYGYDFFDDSLTEMSMEDNGIGSSNKTTYRFGFVASQSHHGVKVDYTLDGVGRIVGIKLGTEDFLSNEYEDNYRYVEKSKKILKGTKVTTKLVNGFEKVVINDEFDNVISATEKGDEVIVTKYIYDDEERVKSITVSNGESCDYSYNEYGELEEASFVTSDGETLKQVYEFNKDRTINKVEIIGDEIYISNKFVYDEKTDAVKEVEFSNSNSSGTLEIEDDSLSRIISEKLSMVINYHFLHKQNI